MPHTNTESDFWKYVRKSDDPDGCWIWIGPKAHWGYGIIRFHGRLWRAHRLSYTWAFGPIPPKLFVCHHCDQPACIRPDHLFLGTQKDNIRDAMHKGRIAKGDASGARMHPEKLARGDKSGARLHIERMPRGDKHGSHTHPELVRRGEAVNTAKLSVNQVLEIREQHVLGISLTELGRRMGVSKCTIWAIVHRKNWKHI